MYSYSKPLQQIVYRWCPKKAGKSAKLENARLTSSGRILMTRKLSTRIIEGTWEEKPIAFLSNRNRKQFSVSRNRDTLISTQEVKQHPDHLEESVHSSIIAKTFDEGESLYTKSKLKFSGETLWEEVEESSGSCQVTDSKQQLIQHYWAESQELAKRRSQVSHSDQERSSRKGGWDGRGEKLRVRLF